MIQLLDQIGTYKNAGGDESLFIVACVKNKLKIYSSFVNLGTVYHDKSTWFRGHNEEYFFDKGAFFTAINKKLRIPLILQFLIRHKEFLEKVKFSKAFKCMIQGSNSYINYCKKNKKKISIF